MAPLMVEGDSLVEKYRSFNKIVKQSTQVDIAAINYGESDFENFYKIDIACKNRNVDYILKVFQCEDMLYASRAIKRSTWLVKDQQYAHIINVRYFYDELYSNMMPKAFKKLLLNVRLNLKDEERAEEFFSYYYDIDFKLSLKWLPLCSENFTVNIIQKRAVDFPDRYLKRLCEKSVTYLEVYSHIRSSHMKNYVFTSTNYHLKRNMIKYLHIIESCENFFMPKLGRRTTKFIMKNDPERVSNNLQRYRHVVHIPTFAKFIKQENMKQFMITHKKGPIAGFWFTDKYIRPLFNRLPIENRFDFIKETLVDPKKKSRLGDNVVFHPGSVIPAKYRSKDFYRWYKYAPFDTAFEDLVQLMRFVSEPAERDAMFEILVTCAGDDFDSIDTLLKHYRQNHLKEPNNYKAKFVELVFSCKKTYRFKKETWEHLCKIYTSLTNNSDKLVQLRTQSTMLRKIILKENILNTLEDNFTFNTFKTYQKELSKEEKEEVFSYLLKHLTSEIDDLDVNNEKECIKIVNLLKNVSNLLVDWNKNLGDFITILHKIKEVVQVNRKNKWKINFTELCIRKNSWNKLLFSESIILCPDQEACISALKFGPHLLQEYKEEIAEIFLNKPVEQFLKYVRKYSSRSLINTYKDFFLATMGNTMKQNTVIEGLFTLLPRNEILKLVEKFTQSNSEMSLVKCIASNLRLVRPLPSPEVALLFTRKGYQRHALPSLITIYDNIIRSKAQDHIASLLTFSLTLQKHGIRYAFTKLKADEMYKMFSVIWTSNKNEILRMYIFDKVFNYICNTRTEEDVKVMFELLGVIIENLSSEANKNICNRLSQLDDVPMSVKPQLWMKCYKFLKSMPPKANCSILLWNLWNCISDVAEHLDDDFVAEILFEDFDENFGTKVYEYQCIVAILLLSTKTEEAHIARYNKILVPILEKSFSMWNHRNWAKHNLLRIFEYLDGNFQETVLKKQTFMPIPMYTYILHSLQANLNAEENYIVITSRKMALDCIKIFDEVLKSNKELKSDKVLTEDEYYSKWKPLYSESSTKFSETCINYLKEDFNIYYPSIYELFARAIKDIFEIYFSQTWYRTFEPFLKEKDFVYGFLLVIKLMPIYLYSEEELHCKHLLLEELRAHPSREVNMHYRHLLNKFALSQD